MQSFSRHAIACVGLLFFTMSFLALECEAQTVTARPSDSQVLRERVAIIFRETLKQGERAFEHNGRRVVVSRTFVPPPPWYVNEIRDNADDAIPILAEYLRSNNGFEKYLALRFLGLIGDSRVVAPLREVALNDASSSFRFTAVLWLSVAPWDLASPIIRDIASNDSSAEVREKAKEILLQHALNK